MRTLPDSTLLSTNRICGDAHFWVRIMPGNVLPSVRDQAAGLSPAAEGSADSFRVREVRAHLPEGCRTKSTVKGVILFLMSASAWAATFTGTLMLPGWALKTLAALANSVCVAALFVVGHDACHGSLTPRSWLNKLIGRLAFLPSLHPYSSWDHSHNGLHHSWTNLRGKDPGYAPFSKREFDSLPAFRRISERAYRTTLGLGLIYLVEVWWKYEVFPNKSCRPVGKRKIMFQIDRAVVGLFLLAELFIVFTSFRTVSLTRHAHLKGVGITLLLPYLLWNWLMGFLTFLHHTNPKVPWYGNVKEWSYFAGQVRSVVHIEFFRPVELLLHNIMDHTAHHVDPRIPLYNLPASQRSLETTYEPEIVIETWTLANFRRTIRTCKLYDYDHHRWLDFAGQPTTDCILTSGEPR